MLSKPLLSSLSFQVATRCSGLRQLSSFVVDVPATPSVAVVDSSDRFPVHRIYCVGQNYADHAKEMGGTPEKGIRPTFFTKPADAVVPSGEGIPYPLVTENLNYEVELVVGIGKGGVDIPVDTAMSHIYGAGVGIDLTKRDLQLQQKNAGGPWDIAKAFDESAPISPLLPVADIATEDRKIELTVNGAVVQSATLDLMIWSIPEVIAELSKLFHLQPGDLIFTGTPAGVGSINVGDKLVGTIDGLPSVEMEMLPPRN